MKMIWCVFLVILGLTSARDVRNVDPAYLEALRASGQDAEFAKLLGVDVSLVRPNNKEQRAEESGFMNVSPLGDILLLDEDEQERQGINFARYGGSRWPNNRIPYSITRGDFNRDQINFIEDAIAQFNRKVRNLQLVRRTNENDYVQVINGNGCWSYLGRIRNQQALSLQRDGCLTVGTVQHEFLHAAGFAHEHNRADRDNHVEVLWNNIPERWRSQYEKVDENDYRTIGGYDYYSVMHYPIWAPDNWSEDAFKIPSGVDRNRLGQNDGVSNMDVDKVNNLYS